MSFHRLVGLVFGYKNEGLARLVLGLAHQTRTHLVRVRDALYGRIQCTEYSERD